MSKLEITQTELIWRVVIFRHPDGQRGSARAMYTGGDTRTFLGPGFGGVGAQKHTHSACRSGDSLIRPDVFTLGLSSVRIWLRCGNAQAATQTLS